MTLSSAAASPMTAPAVGAPLVPCRRGRRCSSCTFGGAERARRRAPQLETLRGRRRVQAAGFTPPTPAEPTDNSGGENVEVARARARAPVSSLWIGLFLLFFTSRRRRVA